jgi:hypothetical protein
VKPFDARDAVLCSWIFDLDRTTQPPFGFTLLRTWPDRKSGCLGALLRDAAGRAVLVNRGTALETLRADMAANIAIHLGRPAPYRVEAALRMAEDAAEPGLRLLGQSLGGGLAQLQALALWHAGLAVRFATFAASDVGSVAKSRLRLDVNALPATLGDNWIAEQDRLTGPHGLFGQSRIGTQHVVRDMRGPRWSPFGLAFHRATAWVNYAAGQRVDAVPPPHPVSAAAWRAFSR